MPFQGIAPPVRKNPVGALPEIRASSPRGVVWKVTMVLAGSAIAALARRRFRRRGLSGTSAFTR